MFSRAIRSSTSSRAFSSTPRNLAIFEKATADVFEKEVLSTDKDKITLVDWYADWCGPCRMLAPTLHKVAKNESLNIDLVTVDTEELVELAQKYRISSLPTVMAFKNGEVVDKFMGMRNEKAVLEFVKKQA